MLFIAWLSACAPPQSQKQETVLEVWTIALKPKFTAYMEGLWRSFEKQHCQEQVRVEWVDVPQQNLMQKLTASIAGGVPPDLVNLTTQDALLLARSGALAAVSDLISPQAQADYFPELWKAARYENRCYAFPWYLSTRVFIFNRKLLQQAGWSPQHPPQTWAETARLAEKVRQANPQAYGFFPVVRILDDWQRDGVEIFDPHTGQARFHENPRAASRLEWYADLYRRGLIPPETLIDGFQGAMERYKQGQLAMMEAGPQMLVQIKADAPEVYAVTGIAVLPASRANVLPASLMNLAVPRSSKHRALAASLALHLTSPAAQLAFAKEVPLLPSSQRAAADVFFQQGKGEALQDEAVRVSLKQLPQARDFSLGLVHSRDLEKVIAQAGESAIYGRQSALEALQKAAEDWNVIVASSRR